MLLLILCKVWSSTSSSYFPSHPWIIIHWKLVFNSLTRLMQYFQSLILNIEESFSQLLIYNVVSPVRHRFLSSFPSTKIREIDISLAFAFPLSSRRRSLIVCHANFEERKKKREGKERKTFHWTSPFVFSAWPRKHVRH